MCINRSVGHNGRNRTTDVKMIQTMLNLNRYQYKKANLGMLKIDGLIGDKTIKAIKNLKS